MSFDHSINAAKNGYAFVWRERATLARLAIIPFAARAGCVSAIYALGFAENPLIERLLLLPALFAQGWFMATLIHRIGKQGQGDLRLLQAGMVAYVLIDLLVALVAFGVLTTLPNPATAKPSLQVALAALGGLVAIVWAFRFVWLHIPTVLGVPWWAYLHRVRGMMGSLRLLVVFMMATLPLSLVFMAVVDVAIPRGTWPPPLSVRYALEMLFVPMELILLVLTTASMTYSIRAILQEKES